MKNEGGGVEFPPEAHQPRRWRDFYLPCCEQCLASRLSRAALSLATDYRLHVELSTLILDCASTTCNVDYFVPRRTSGAFTSHMKKKNSAAVALGKLAAKARLKNMTADERKQTAARGGKAAWANVSAAERSRIMTERRRKGRQQS